MRGFSLPGLLLVAAFGWACSQGGDSATAPRSADSAGVQVVASLSIVPSSLSDSAGQGSHLTALVKDSSGRPVPGITVNWASSNPAVARVDSTGLVEALVPGSAAISATAAAHSAIATIAVKRVASSVPWPEEPDGLVTRSEQPFDALDSFGWQASSTGRDDAVAASDSSALWSPPHVLRFNYHPGMAGGGAPGLVKFPHAASKEVFAGLWWKPSDPWENHPSNVNKLAFWQTNTWGSSVDIQLYGPAPYQLQVVTEFPAGTARLRPNVTTTTVMLGTWHRVEWHLRYASAAGGSDGLVEWWLDGILQGRYSNVQTPSDSGFTEFQRSPTWGGVGGVKSEADYFLYDEVNISTR